MWSGGAKVTSYDEVNKTSERILDQTKQYNDLGEKVTERRNAASDQQEELTKARREEGIKESDSLRLQNEARSRDEAVTQARESRDQYRHQHEDALKALDPERTRLAGMWDMHRFMQQRYEIDFFGAYQKGCLELICENQNWGRAALLAWHAACARVAAAELGQRSTLNTVMEKPTYFRIPEIPRNQAPDYRQQAQSLENEIAEKEKNIRSRLADPFYDRALSEKMARSHKTSAESAAAKSAFDTAEKAAKSAESVWKTRREEMDQAGKAQTEKGHEIKALDTAVAGFTNLKREEAEQRQNQTGRRTR